MPNRLIKETIRTSKKVNALPDSLYRIWTYLITYVDDYGRGSADPEILKGYVFTRRKNISEEQIPRILQELANRGMITLYEVDGEPFFYFPNWEQHQQVRAKKSKFPAPEINGNQTISNDSTCARNPIQSNTESNPESNPSFMCVTRARAREKDDGFEEFWNAYPRKVGGKIQQAYMEYIHVTEDLGIDPQVLIAAAKAQGRTVTSETMRYFPSAENWLMNRGWEQKEPQETETNNVFLQIYNEEHGK